MSDLRANHCESVSMELHHGSMKLFNDFLSSCLRRRTSRAIKNDKMFESSTTDTKLFNPPPLVWERQFQKFPKYGPSYYELNY